jgi:hypothetical protein
LLVLADCPAAEVRLVRVEGLAVLDELESVGLARSTIGGLLVRGVSCLTSVARAPCTIATLLDPSDSTEVLLLLRSADVLLFLRGVSSFSGLVRAEDWPAVELGLEPSDLLARLARMLVRLARILFRLVSSFFKPSGGKLLRPEGYSTDELTPTSSEWRDADGNAEPVWSESPFFASSACGELSAELLPAEDSLFVSATLAA